MTDPKGSATLPRMEPFTDARDYNPRKPTRLQIQRYTEGDCAHLAKAVEAISDWPAYAYFQQQEGYYGCWDVHCFNRLPDGRRLDIYGVQSVSDFNRPWKSMVADLRTVRRVDDWTELEDAWGAIGIDDYTHDVAEKLVEHAENVLLKTFSGRG